MDKRVPHDFKYHAEIMYETIDGFNFCHASGDSVDELLWDLDDRLSYYKHRDPKIVTALKNPNFKKENITKEIIEIYYSRGGK
jgi:hypothetical protein